MHTALPRSKGITQAQSAQLRINRHSNCDGVAEIKRHTRRWQRYFRLRVPDRPDDHAAVCTSDAHTMPAPHLQKSDLRQYIGTQFIGIQSLKVSACSVLLTPHPPLSERTAHCIEYWSWAFRPPALARQAAYQHACRPLVLVRSHILNRPVIGMHTLAACAILHSRVLVYS